MDHLTRRGFLAGTAGTAAIMAAGSVAEASSSPAPVGPLPEPGQSGIDHIVVVMMENRSFDHYLGWLPGADGRQAGLSFTDRSGRVFMTRGLAPDWQGCAHPDPDHSWAGGRTQLDG